MNPLEILRREQSIILKYLSELEEMTCSVCVNTRDFSFLVRELCRFWDEHQKKEQLLFRVLAEEGIRVPVEIIQFRNGKLARYEESILDAADSGEDEKIKEVLYRDCGEIVDLIKAHILAEEYVFTNVAWEKLNKETLGKIKLIQILASEELLED